MLKKGEKAPEFILKNQADEDVALSSLLGKKVILYFYPKDNTPGCTTEACSFRDNIEQITDKNAVVVGVSPDSTKSHRKFIEKQDLNFTLLSDSSTEMLQQYGVWKEKSMCGKKYMGVERTTVIIDEQGVVSEIFEKVKVAGHTAEVISVLG